LEINQGYSTMHGQPTIRIVYMNFDFLKLTLLSISSTLCAKYME